MVLPNVALRLLVAGCVITGVAFAGGAMAAPGATELTDASTTVAVVADTAEKPNPACSRKVKVVYAGYGEADRLGCASAAKVGE